MLRYWNWYLYVAKHNPDKYCGISPKYHASWLLSSSLQPYLETHRCLFTHTHTCTYTFLTLSHIAVSSILSCVDVDFFIRPHCWAPSVCVRVWAVVHPFFLHQHIHLLQSLMGQEESQAKKKCVCHTHTHTEALLFQFTYSRYTHTWRWWRQECQKISTIQPV